MSPVNVYVPCDAVTVRVRIDYGRGLSPIEQHVLRAVHAGHRSMEALAGFFGLTDRLVLDLVFDLWRSGHLMIDFHTSRIELSRITGTVLGADGRGDLSRMPGARTADERREVLIDQLTGRVVPAYLGLRRARDPRFAVPVLDSGFDAGGMHAQELLAALNRELEHAPGTRPVDRSTKRAVTAHVPPAQLRGGINRRWLQAEVRLGVDEATDRLQVAVLDRELSVSEREKLAGRITQVVEDDPDSEFSRTLRANIDWEYDDPPRLADSLRALQRSVPKGPPPAGTRTQRHAQLRSDADQAYALLRAHVAREVDVDVLSDPAEQRQRMHKLITDARHQVVLVAPKIHYEGLRALQPEIKEAFRRGVRILLVWGRKASEELDDKVANALRDLRGERTGASLLAWGARSARTNACFAVGDDQQVVIGSYNVLDLPDPAVPVHAGLALSAPHGTPGCAPVVDLLQWARRAVPDYVLGSSVRLDFAPVAPDQDAAGASGETVAKPEFPDTPPETQDGLAGTLTAWSDGWASVVAQLTQATAARTRPIAAVLVDGAHRDELWRAARAAERRLVIADGTLDPMVVGRRFLSALANRLDRGTHVTLVYEHIREGETDAQRGLEALAREYPDRLRLLKTPHNRVRAIVADDELVLGSFGFLSTAEVAARGGWHRRRSDVGLRITDAALADTVAARLGVEAPPEPAIALGPVVPDQETMVDLPMATAAQKLLVAVSAAEGAARTAELIARALADQPDPWALLDYLENKAPARLVRIAAASCLRRPDARDDQDRRSRWLRWLVLERWNASAYVEAAVLREGLPDDKFRPRRAVARIAALRGKPRFGTEFEAAVYDCADQPADSPERLAVTAAGFAELLSGRDDGDERQVLEMLTLLVEDGSPWASGYAGLTKLFGSQLGFPAAAIREAVALFRRDESLVDDWNQLARRFGRAAQVRFRFEAGIRTSVELFRVGGIFGRLRDTVANRDLRGVRDFLRQPELADLDRTLDNVTRAVGLPTRLLQGSQRHNYVLRLREVVAAARQVAGAQVPAADPGVSPHAGAVAKALAAAWDAIREQNAAVDEGAPEQRLLNAAMEDIELVVEWGRHA